MMASCPFNGNDVVIVATFKSVLAPWNRVRSADYHVCRRFLHSNVMIMHMLKTFT